VLVRAARARGLGIIAEMAGQFWQWVASPASDLFGWNRGEAGPKTAD
jgi:hypothetical protein